MSILQPLTHSSILIVDDNPGVLYATSKILSYHKFEVTPVRDAEQAIAQVKTHSFDLIVCDINMPGRSGLEFLNEVRAFDPTIPSVVLTASGSVGMAIEAMKSGALGFVTKPFQETELMESVNAALQQAQRIRHTLETEVYTPMLEGLCNALLNTMEANDYATEGSSQRVARQAQVIAAALNLPPEQSFQIYLAGLFHDIGKIGIADTIVKKIGSLTPDEQKEMARHPELGARIIEQAPGMSEAANMIRHHHERYDGTGYPSKFVGKDIPLGSRIVAIADVYEALTHHRTYASIFSHEEAIAELMTQSGKQFDPDILEVAIKVLSTR